MSEKRFEIEKEKVRFNTEITIITDKVTGIQYLFYGEGYAGGLTILLDSDGKVQKKLN